MILITGGTGFIGTALIKRLLEAGEEIRLLKLYSEKTDLPVAEVLDGDILDPDSLKEAVKGVDKIVHLAGVVSYTMPKEQLFKINVEGTKNMLAACSKVKRFVFASSVSVYGPRKGLITEDTPTMPMNDYGSSKLEAEEAVLESGLNYVIVRMAPIYGAGSPQWMKNLKLLDSGFPVPNVKTMTHVLSIDNAAQALQLALTGSEGVYNIADDKPVPFVDFTEEILRLLGKEPKRMPLWLLKIGASFKGLGPYLDVLVHERNYDLKEARKGLGYKPDKDFDNQLKRMVKWYTESK